MTSDSLALQSSQDVARMEEKSFRDKLLEVTMPTFETTVCFPEEGELGNTLCSYWL